MKSRSLLLAAARARRGMTLVEIMIVIAIIGIITTVVAVNVMGAKDEADRSAACIQMKNIEGALTIYAAKHKSQYPSTGEGLAAAKSLLPQNEVPTDPWGAPYQYFSPGTHGQHDFELISLGKDKREGGADAAADIYSWDCNK